MTLQFGPSILGAKIVVDDQGAVPTLSRLKLGIGAARAEFGGLNGAVATTQMGLGRLVGGLAAVTGGVASLSFGVGGSVRSFLDFEQGIAKIGTLLPAGSNAMRMYGDTVLNLSQQFGMGAGMVAEGMFQAISASVPAEQATRFMEVAGKAAAGGFTSMATAVDGLTTVINAYGMNASQAERVADAFFLANKAGKTTFEELARTLGNVVPIAAAVDVGYQDVAAAIAAVTKQGIQTSVVTTGLRQALASILKPSEQAKDLAKDLGLNFSEGALKARGFQRFMVDVAKATEGSAGKMVELFGSVEAANIIMALTSKTGMKDFNATLKEMLTTSGQTAEAFGVTSETTGHKFRQFSEKINSMLIKIGDAIAVQFGGDVEELGNKIVKWIPKAEEAIRGVVQTIRKSMDMIANILEAVLITKGIGYITRFTGALTKGVAQFSASVGGVSKQIGPRLEDGSFASGKGAGGGLAGIAGKIGQVGLAVQAAYITAQAGYFIGEHVVPEMAKWVGYDPVGQAKTGAQVNRAANLMGTNDSILPMAMAMALAKGDMSSFQAVPMKAPQALGFRDQEQVNKVVKALVEDIQKNVPRTEKAYRFERAPGYDALAQRKVEYDAPRSVVSIQSDIAERLASQFETIVARVKTQDERTIANLVDGLIAVADPLRTFADSQSHILDAIMDAGRVLAAGVWIGVDHKIKDEKKDRKHVVRASRGDGVAKHLNPRYRVSILRSGSAAGIIEPLRENYHAPHLINGGG